MFYLVGTGIYDDEDISCKGMEICKKADKVYMEKYTSEIEFDVERFEKRINKKVVFLDRKGVEEEKKYLKEAKTKDVVLLIPGDPLSATTHTEIIQECIKKEVKYKVVHSSSVFSAVAETGLSLYRFGRVVSLPFPSEDFFPLTPIEYIKKNMDNGLHTLVLLDIKMTINEGLEIIENMEIKKGLKVNNKVVVCAHLGKDSEIYYGKRDVLKKKKYGRLPHCIVIPSNLEFYEEEFLEIYKVYE